MTLRKLILGLGVGGIVACGGCRERAPITGATVPEPNRHVARAIQMGDEEEIIGTGLDNTAYDTVINGHTRMKYKVTIAGPSGRIDGQDMYVMKDGDHHFGWFVSKMPDCGTGPGAQKEMHDVSGDGVADTSQTEVHCVPNGEYTVSLWRFDQDPDSDTPLFARKVAMLDDSGSVNFIPTSNKWYDVRVSFDLTATPPLFHFEGGIRADTLYRRTEQFNPDSLSGTARTFWIGVDRPVWFMSTFVPVPGPMPADPPPDTALPPYNAPPPPGSSWMYATQRTLTGFKFDFAHYPNDATGGINSEPEGIDSWSPLQHRYAESGVFKVVGHVAAPVGDFVDQDTITVNVGIYPSATACFTYSDTLQAGSVVTFNASCSTGTGGTLEFRWTFGDGSPPLDWSTGQWVVPHTYATGGQYDVLLQVRLQQDTSVAADTTQMLTITPAPAPPLSAVIAGPTQVTTSGSCFWTATATGGTPPYHYQWYYRRIGQGGDVPVGTDSPVYTRDVTVEPTGYTFRLQAVVTDALLVTAHSLFWYVDVGGGGARPLRPNCS